MRSSKGYSLPRAFQFWGASLALGLRGLVRLFAARDDRRRAVRATLLLTILLAGVGLWWLGWRSPSDPYALPEVERRYLWDMEHHVNLLNQFGFKALGKAIVSKDRPGLQRIMAEEFAAEMMGAPQEVRWKDELMSLSRGRQEEGPYQRVGAANFIDWLLALRERFVEPPQFRFDVMKMLPPSHDDFEGTWQALCVLRLWDAAETSGRQEIVLQCQMDVDHPSKERLKEPGWLLACTVRQLATARSTRPLFREVTSERGINVAGMHDNWTVASRRAEMPAINSGGIYACDYNHDGYVDLLVTDIGPGGNRLYKGMPGGKFVDDTALLPVEATHGGVAAFVDLDNDGWEDLYVISTGVVCRNIQGVAFRNVTSMSNLPQLLAPFAEAPGYISGAIIADFDRDGLLDMYVTRSLPPVGSWLQSTVPDAPPCRLLRNLGDFRFEDVTLAMGAGDGGRSVFTAAWLDVNNDNWPDLYVINEFGNGLLLENREGRGFVAREIVDHPSDFGSMGLACGDINNDGQIDIYSCNMYSKAGSRVMANLPPGRFSESTARQLHSLIGGSQLYLNRGGGSFDPAGKRFQVHAVGWSWGAALADLNNDGWLDLYATAGFISRDRTKPDG